MEIIQLTKFTPSFTSEYVFSQAAQQLYHVRMRSKFLQQVQLWQQIHSIRLRGIFCNSECHENFSYSISNLILFIRSFRKLGPKNFSFWGFYYVAYPYTKMKSFSDWVATSSITYWYDTKLFPSFWRSTACIKICLYQFLLLVIQQHMLLIPHSLENEDES